MPANQNQDSNFINTLKDYQIQSKLSNPYQTSLNSPLRDLWANMQVQDQQLSNTPSQLQNPELVNSLKQFNDMRGTFQPPAPRQNQRPQQARQPNTGTSTSDIESLLYQSLNPSNTKTQQSNPNRDLFLNTMSKLYDPKASTYNDEMKNQINQDLETSYTGLSAQPTNLQDTELVNALKSLYQSSNTKPQPDKSPNPSPTTPATSQNTNTSEVPQTAPDQNVQEDPSANWLRQYGKTHGIDPQQVEDFIAGKIERIETPDNDPNADLADEPMDPTGTYSVIPAEEEQDLIQDPQTRQDLEDIYSTQKFADPMQEQQTMMKFAHNPQLQNHFMAQNPQMVMNTALGQSLEGIANQYILQPGNPMSERYRQRFDQGTAIYQDPFSGEQVSRPNFFQRLNSALKYLFKGDGENNLSMQGDQLSVRNMQSQPSRLPYTANNPFQYPATYDQFTPSSVMANPLPFMNMGNMGAEQQPNSSYSVPPSAYLGSEGNYGTSDGMMAGLYSPPLLSKPLYSR